jgi:hypothetical protein
MALDDEGGARQFHADLVPLSVPDSTRPSRTSATSAGGRLARRAPPP